MDAAAGRKLRFKSENVPRINKTIIEQAWNRRGEKLRQVVRDGACRGLALVGIPPA